MHINCHHFTKKDGENNLFPVSVMLCNKQIRYHFKLFNKLVTEK